MGDLTLSIVNIVTATTTVIITLLLTENYENGSSPYEPPSCQLNENCSQIDLILAQIKDDLKNGKVTEASSLWTNLESNLIGNMTDSSSHPRNIEILKGGLFTLVNESQSFQFKSVFIPWLKNVNIHIRLNGYERILDNLETQQKQNEDNNELNDDITIFANFLKNEWLSLKKIQILNKFEQKIFLSTLKKFSIQIKKLIFSSTVVIRSVDGYLYGTGNKEFWLDSQRRTVFLWTPKDRSTIAREGVWQIIYDEHDNSYLISNHYWKENLYSMCQNYNNSKEETDLQTVFTLKSELGEKHDCLSKWSIDRVNNDDNVSTKSSVQIYLKNVDTPETIFPLSLDKKPKMTTSNYNYRTQIFTEKLVNPTSEKLSLIDSWEIVPLAYIY